MEENLINKFQTIYNNIVTEKGNTYLFMIIKMDELIDKWSVIASASWITRDNQRDSFTHIATELERILTREELITIARIGIFQPEDHIVKLFNSSFRVQGGNAVRLQNTKLNGFQVHEAYVFESVPPTTV